MPVVVGSLVKDSGTVVCMQRGTTQRIECRDAPKGKEQKRNCALGKTDVKPDTPETGESPR